jgi:hypothetical protein
MNSTNNMPDDRIAQDTGPPEPLANTLYCSSAYSALACLRIGMSGSASFHKARNV